ncbi:hypothetical protein VM1G_10100 [Cytospora mali]|uniref:C2H2-type domain-containing protein n=1 Tax=Cytospora mali TaxID=578113 RepID=A0A194WDS9_CYTMA|nr:hypothetical protein VM1G_10100 [Valsa mali]
MLLRPLLAAAGLTAVTQALLLPPEITSHDIDILESIPIESIAISKTQTINLDCPGCPPVFSKHHGKPKHHKQPHNSHLKLDFSIDRAPAGDRLMLNGFELYPHSDPFTNVLIAPQVAEKPKHEKGKHGKHEKEHDENEVKALLSHHKSRPKEGNFVVEQQLGFSLGVHPVENTADEGLDLIVIDLQIIEVGSVFVDGLANTRISLIKTPDNQLLIGKIEQTPSETVSTPMAEDKECTTTLCKWKAIVADQLNKMKMHGCAGMMGAKAGHGDGHVHGDAHPHQPHGHNGLFDKPNGWTLLFRKLTSHIVLPVLVGIAAGVSVSIIGMIVGTILVGFWRKFVRGQSFFPQHRRRSHSSSSHHKAARMEAAAAEEKAGLMQEEAEELPPAYEDEAAVVEERTIA